MGILPAVPGCRNCGILPEEWRDIDRVDVFRIGLDGRVPVARDVRVHDGMVVLSLAAEEARSIVPAGGA